MSDLNQFVVVQDNADDIKAALQEARMFLKKMFGCRFDEWLFCGRHGFFGETEMQAASGFYFGKDHHIPDGADDINFFMPETEVGFQNFVTLVD